MASFEGSVAIAAHAAADPDQVLLALRGSGQALYVGLAEDAFVVASEPYGLVEETPLYLRMDGETPADPDNPNASRGQVVALDRRRAGDASRASSASPTTAPRCPCPPSELVDRPRSPPATSTAASTRTSCSRRSARRRLSFRKTLRGQARRGPRRARGAPRRRHAPRRRRAPASPTAPSAGCVAIGQGTAAVAAQSFASRPGRPASPTRRCASRPSSPPSCRASPCASTCPTRWSSPSASPAPPPTPTAPSTWPAPGGRTVVAIVNRRNSDLTDKSDGVLYTSDGRDVEMAVPSTKAFYAQVAAGMPARRRRGRVGRRGRRDAGGPAQPARGPARPARRHDHGARPPRPTSAASPPELAPSRRYWAIVGNGTNRIAAQEVRIKLSELCYKSIACDVTEDKKHIDLSAEPLILVCAAGLSGSTADDVAKEVAIYRAHKAAPIVIATEGEGRFGAALHVIDVPPTHPQLAFVLSADGRPPLRLRGGPGHRRAGPAAPRGPRRTSRSSSSDGVTVGEVAAGPPAPGRCARRADRFFDGLRAGEYDGHLEASHRRRACRRCCATPSGMVPLDAYQAEHGKVGTPAVVIDDLTAALTRAIEELTRPIDAIKHQAKTVTVGISRTDETLLQVPLVAAGARRRRAPRLASATARCKRARRPRPRRRRGAWASSATASRATRPSTATPPTCVVDRGGVALELPEPQRARPGPVGHQAPGRPRAGAAGGPRAAATAAPS